MIRITLSDGGAAAEFAHDVCDRPRLEAVMGGHRRRQPNVIALDGEAAAIQALRYALLRARDALVRDGNYEQAALAREAAIGDSGNGRYWTPATPPAPPAPQPPPAAHSPLPWRQNGRQHFSIVDADDERTADTYDDRDTRLIVHRVNTYPQLVAALRDAEAWWSGGPPSTIAAMRAALAAAEQQQATTCDHRHVMNGPRIPLPHGSAPSEVCVQCGAYRDMRGGKPGDWKPGPLNAAKQEEATR